MNILVIGGNGFIGRAFAKRCMAAGHTVTIVSRSAAEVPLGTQQVVGGIEALCASPELIEATDFVCHTASATIPSTSMSAPLSDIDGNLRPLASLLEAMRSAGKRNILFLSSGGAVYGRPEKVPISEDHPRRPISHYGLTKLMMETYLDFFAREHGFLPAIVRPSNPYGRGQNKIGQLGAVTTFLQMIEEGRVATVFGDGSTVRDFVHVDDLADMMVRIVETGAHGIWNCGGGTGTSLSELITLLEHETGRRLAIAHKPARPFDPPTIVLDIKRAQQELGWAPQISLNAGVRRLVSP